eukprot:COSAG04_NODE_414_length_14737_cov_79.200779_9_plen_106_part_00
MAKGKGGEDELSVDVTTTPPKPEKMLLRRGSPGNLPDGGFQDLGCSQEEGKGNVVLDAGPSKMRTTPDRSHAVPKPQSPQPQPQPRSSRSAAIQRFVQKLVVIFF